MYFAVYLLVCGLCSLSWALICSVFFFKQKTVYEMRISDWSSDVCSSDLPHLHLFVDDAARNIVGHEAVDLDTAVHRAGMHDQRIRPRHLQLQIGRASCRERVCQYV